MSHAFVHWRLNLIILRPDQDQMISHVLIHENPSNFLNNISASNVTKKQIN